MNNQPDNYLREKQIRPGILPVSHSTFWAWVKEGKLPQGTKLSPRVTVWKASDIYALVK